MDGDQWGFGTVQSMLRDFPWNGHSRLVLSRILNELLPEGLQVPPVRRCLSAFLVVFWRALLYITAPRDVEALSPKETEGNREHLVPWGCSTGSAVLLLPTGRSLL